MSFKCSIFGHDYGDPEVERDREEQGSEVVITIRETETCQRCGDVRVVSENKEVTTVETAADIVADDLEDESDDSEEETVDPTETEIPDAESGEAVEEQSAGSPTIPDDSQDDAVILDEEDEEDDRDPGEWPEEGEDDETQPQTPEAEQTDRDPGEWPEEESEDDDWEPQIDPDPEEGPTIERTDSAVTVPKGEFRCPECGYTTPVESSSLRAGDFCPECHRGALEHHLDE